MGFKDEFKREMRNVMKDVEKEVDRTWEIDYKGHRIEIVNKIKEEQLIIDGITVDRNKRKYILSHLIPYSKLSGMLELEDGTKRKISVKIGGYKQVNCIVKVGNETILEESFKLEIIPWEHKEKIVPFIRKQMETHNKIVDDRLPDEEFLYDENHPRMAAGLSDSFTDDTPFPFYAKKLLKLFEEQINDPATNTRKRTYEKIMSDNIVSYRDEFIERFSQAGLDESLVQQEALWLLEHAAHREVVKFAITVLGCTDCEKYKELLFTLGMHEEFTAYVIFALKNGTTQANNEIWRLAQALHGWGKIAAVEQLEAPTPEIKHWLLTEGCSNTIMNEYLAYTCAVNGELDVALYEKTISKELYDGASRIIEALLSENAPEGIEEYSDAGAVLSRFVYHAHTHCKPTLEDFYALMKISEFINDEEEIWEERFNEQWKEHERTAIQEAIQAFINDPKWPQLAMDALKQDGNIKALEIAQFYQLDIIQNLFDLLEKYPTNIALYSAVMETNDRQHIQKLCAFAETHLSLTSLSEDEQDCLQCIVQDLYEHEGVGVSLIEAALKSENGGLQYHALSVLTEWSPSFAQEPAMQRAIKDIADKTKDKEDRQLAKQLLKK
ncbi:hypothetical protein [Oceanobacillus chungangensis]|uniref:Uncharacterized protein n=1 Tax=Oceanobacillus chungangensis TaxID=1229152 RepID=A0A3D8PM26_9BACI|nr:hypothetical protein [Oceanobacillus chungangensis]RDW16722.1 hypothetical protein CWR45_13930 [Oceanobacillus chungangensis]